jgi:50S ribosomal subunit-associated GTPase HflX
VVVVLDRSEPIGGLDRAVLADHPDSLVVANKSDLPALWDAREIGALAVSAERGDGIETLVRAIADRLVPEAPAPESAVPFRPIQARWLRLLRDCFREGRADRARRSIGRIWGEEI